jgi:di/tricarboxylate transporter
MLLDNSWSEISVAVVFLLMILLWITKDFSGTPGWESLFREKYISDGTVAILCGILPLILPNANPFEHDWTYKPIIEWNQLAKHMPWGALILLGAGLAVASAFQVSRTNNSICN